MNLGIKDKRALVTGASRGIGESIAVNLSSEGVRVAVVARTNKDLQMVLRNLKGKEHYMIVADLTEDGVPANVIRELEQNFGKLDILVNNLGSTLDITDPFCSLSDWRKVYRINFEVAVEMNNLVIPDMKKKHWGRIVNISSTAGMENNGPITYCSMKAALTAYSRSMGRVLARNNVVMSAVMPGAILTKGGFWDKALKERPKHVQKYLAERCPTGEFGVPDDIGSIVTMLCSQQAKFCQGTIMPVDGGQSRHFFWTREF